MLGEPLLNTNIFDLIRHANDNKLKTSLISNGLLLSPKIAAMLSNSGLDYLMLSLHTPFLSIEDFEKLRGIKYDFDSYLNKIFVFLEELIKIQSNIQVYIYIQSNEGIKQYYRIGKYCKWDWFKDEEDRNKKLNNLFILFENFAAKMRATYPKCYERERKIDNDTLELIHSGRIVTTKDRIDTSAFMENSDSSFFQGWMFYPGMFIKYKSFGLVTNEPNFLKNCFDLKNGQYAFIEEACSELGCTDMLVNAAVNSDGDVCLCCGDCDNEYPLGNIHNMPLEEVYESNKYYQIIENQYLSKMCRRCKGKIIFLDDNNNDIYLSGQISDNKFPFYLFGLAQIYTTRKTYANKFYIELDKSYFLKLNIKILKADKPLTGTSDIKFTEDFMYQLEFSYTNSNSLYYQFDNMSIYKIEVSPVLSNIPITDHSIQITNIQLIQEESK